jgi:hypothetical protein
MAPFLGNPRCLILPYKQIGYCGVKRDGVDCEGIVLVLEALHSIPE